MTRITTILTEGYADWEIGMLAAVARGFYGMEVQHATAGGMTVTSAGGLRVMPYLAIEAIDVAATDALIVVGGRIWQTEQAPDVTSLLTRARERDVLIGGICDGTRALAKAGLLDEVGHTSNSLENLLDVGYRGHQLYWDVPHAVSAERIVTAPGTAPVSFMAEILEGLGRGDLNLDFYLGMLAAEHASRIHMPAVETQAAAG